MSKQETDERVRQSKRVEFITGQWWCATGHHMARGNALPHARLNEATVRAIRRNKYGWPRKRWANLLGVHLRTIDKVATYETWRHVK